MSAPFNIKQHLNLQGERRGNLNEDQKFALLVLAYYSGKSSHALIQDFKVLCSACPTDSGKKCPKERLKALIATMLQHVKDLVATKGGYTKWWSNSYNVEQEKWNSTTASLKKMRRFQIETVFVWESIVRLFQLFRAKTTPTFSRLTVGLRYLFLVYGPPPEYTRASLTSKDDVCFVRPDNALPIL